MNIYTYENNINYFYNYAEYFTKLNNTHTDTGTPDGDVAVSTEGDDPPPQQNLPHIGSGARRRVGRSGKGVSLFDLHNKHYFY